ncbi:murein transglycosylase [Neokomagataea tanensis NBRC 106556]|uniref:Murein transglycosylase n=1 Tax=Neokomagataea tanensis NBRC 106556 TaxID=1223519 RepID=A0ABQ0QK60_9PROT|nr:murein transglycosylase [Neokomagataea tanensis NBRC 106556]
MLTGADAAYPAARYEAFLKSGPIWPEHSRLMWRYQTALAQETDTAQLQTLCVSLPLNLPGAVLNCASYLPHAEALARTLWRDGAGDGLEEAALEQRFGASLTASDQWHRFESLQNTGRLTAARRQLVRLTAAQKSLAFAYLALHSSGPDADAAFAALTEQQKNDPIVLREYMHDLRRADRLDDALALWDTRGAAVQRHAPSPIWTNERLALARAFLLVGRNADAARLARDVSLPLGDTARLEAEELSGFIALRALSAPQEALAHFDALHNAQALRFRASGWYWSGRVYTALGESGQARHAYQEASHYPTMIHGQLALAALTDHSALLNGGAEGVGFQHALHDALSEQVQPSPTALTRPDLVDAAQSLAGIGDYDHARLFLLLLQAVNTSPEGQKTVADLSVQLQVPAGAVAASHSLARLGYSLYPQGYPNPWPVDADLPEGIILGVARQESAFNPNALSAAHAVGLLQLLPGAARDVVRHAHLHGYDVSADGLKDPHTNLIVGSAYIRQLLERFDHVIPYALASYNAGPHRVDLWLKANPPVASSGDEALLDWIERLPYRETRLYVLNIEANITLYSVESTFHE